MCALYQVPAFDLVVVLFLLIVYAVIALQSFSGDHDQQQFSYTLQQRLRSRVDHHFLVGQKKGLVI